ncbi:uncharacterized protein [Dysidea avara]|uniref:uncharacterized protein n=1 Tax=Dysidea avara TaxID=196820 RepID=UPI00333469BC
MTIDDLETELSTTHNDSGCVDYALNYLCYFYYPVCSLTTGVVSYTCTSSCGLLVNNQNCSDILSLASNRLENNNFPEPEADCERTSRTPETPMVVAEECISIEETLPVPFPLNCESIESTRCHPSLSYTHFALTGSELINERDKVTDEFDRLGEEIGADHDCLGILRLLDCILSQPACNPDTGTVTPVCLELCPEIDQNIADSCANLSFINDTIHFQHLNHLIQFGCYDPQSYYNFPSSYFSNSSVDCISFGLVCLCAQHIARTFSAAIITNNHHQKLQVCLPVVLVLVVGLTGHPTQCGIVA